MNKIVYFFISLCFLIIWISCHKDPNNNNTANDPNSPKITSVDPDCPRFTDLVLLKGTNLSDSDFGTNIQVFVNGKKSHITSATSTEVYFEMPYHPGSGPITIEKNGKIYSGPNVNYCNDWVFSQPFRHPYNNQFNSGSFFSLTTFASNILFSSFQNEVFKINYAERVITRIAGSSSSGYRDGNGSTSLFSNITGLVKGEGNEVFIADSGNKRIRKVTESGSTSTFSGSGIAGNLDGTSVVARFNMINSITSSKDGILYVVDKSNTTGIVRRVDKLGNVTSFPSHNFLADHAIYSDFDDLIYVKGTGSSGLYNLMVLNPDGSLKYKVEALTNLNEVMDNQLNSTKFKGTLFKGMNGKAYAFVPAFDSNNPGYVFKIENESIKKYNFRINTDNSTHGRSGLVENIGANPFCMVAITDSIFYLQQPFTDGGIRRLAFE